MKRAVLDATALVAFFEDRPGAEQVQQLIELALVKRRELMVTVVNLGEVYYSAWRAHGADAAARVISTVRQLPVIVVDADSELMVIAAQLRAEHNISYPCCFAAALAMLRKATLVGFSQDFRGVQSQVSFMGIDRG